MNDFSEFFDLLFILTFADKGRETYDRIQWGPYLMAHIGEESTCQPV